MGDGFWRRLVSGYTDGEKGGKKPPSTLLLLGLVILGIVFMFISTQPKQYTTPSPAVVDPGEAAVWAGSKPDMKESLERDLASLLRRVRGVGDVEVMVMLESGPVYEYANTSDTSDRTTHEVDSGGGTRQVTESSERTQPVLARGDTNKETPLVTSEMLPRVRGVIVIAEGAEDPVLREQLFRAVQAGLNLAAHRITVLPMK